MGAWAFLKGEAKKKSAKGLGREDAALAETHCTSSFPFHQQTAFWLNRSLKIILMELLSNTNHRDLS